MHIVACFELYNAGMRQAFTPLRKQRLLDHSGSSIDESDGGGGAFERSPEGGERLSRIDAGGKRGSLRGGSSSDSGGVCRVGQQVS